MDLPEKTEDPQGNTTSRLLHWLRAADRWASGSTSSGRARGLLFGSLIALTLGILGWSIHRNWDTLVEFDWQFDLRYLGLSFLCYLVALGQAVSIWHQIMSRLADFANLRQNARLYLYSTAARRLPGFIWYVGSRLYLYQQEGVPKTITSVGLLLDMALTILSGTLVFLGAMPFSELDLLAGGSPWFLLGIVPLLVVTFQPALLIRLLNAILLRLGRHPLTQQIKRQDSLQWVGQYVAGWIAIGLILYCLAWAIHPLPASALPGVVGIVALTGVLRHIAFFIPGAWGLQELSLSLALSPYLPLPLALGIPLLYRLWLIACELVSVVACYLAYDARLPLTRKY